MSLSPSSTEQTVQLHARIAELEAIVGQRDRELSSGEEKLKVVQGHLLKAQVQMMELGDLLAARDTALKNAVAGVPDLQKILDTQLARTNELDIQLRSVEDRYASVQLELAAANERATLAERISRETVAAAQRESEAARAELPAVKADLEGHRVHVQNLENAIAELRASLAEAEETATSQQQRMQSLENENVARTLRVRKIESHWIWRITGPLHD